MICANDTANKNTEIPTVQVNRIETAYGENLTTRDGKKCIWKLDAFLFAAMKEKPVPRQQQQKQHRARKKPSEK